jgi:hypothetical protein
MTLIEECTCDAGYYCRFCRLLDKQDEQRKYDEEHNTYN